MNRLKNFKNKLHEEGFEVTVSDQFTNGLKGDRKNTVELWVLTNTETGKSDVMAVQSAKSRFGFNTFFLDGGVTFSETINELKNRTK